MAKQNSKARRKKRNISKGRGLLKQRSDHFLKDYILKIRNHGFTSRVIWISNFFSKTI